MVVFFPATSFQKSENMNNLIGGSCLKTNTSRNPLRLRIHVCSKEEECNVCSSEGCYYKCEYESSKLIFDTLFYVHFFIT